MTLAYLLARIPLRLLPLASQLDRANATEIARVAAVLQIRPTLDEMEDDVLSESVEYVFSELQRLSSLTHSGELVKGSDAVDRLRNLLSHPSVYVQQLEVTGRRLTLKCYYQERMETRLRRELQELLPSSAVHSASMLKLVLQRTVTEDLINALDLVLGKTYTLSVTDQQVTVTAQTSFTATELQQELNRFADLQVVARFINVEGQGYDFIHEELLATIKQLEPSSQAQIRRLDLQAYNGQVLVLAEAEETVRDLLRLLTDSVLQQYLSAQGHLRYCRLNSASFHALEDLTVNDKGLTSPYASSSQLTYARIQGYDENKSLQELLRRHQQYVTSGQITHTLTRKIHPTQQGLILHHLFKRLQRLLYRDRLAVSITDGQLSITGHILTIQDAIALYTFIIAAELETDQPNLERLQTLTRLEGGATAAEIVTFMSAHLPTKNFTPRLLLLPYDRVPSVAELRSHVLDLTEVRYYQQGQLQHYYSVILNADNDQQPTTAAELLQLLHTDYSTIRDDYRQLYRQITTGAQVANEQANVILRQAKTELGLDYDSPYRDRVQVDSQDYRLAVYDAGRYYRLSVLATVDKPVDNFTLCHVPKWLLEQQPDLLDLLHAIWRKGGLLTDHGRELYRHTRILWGVEAILPQVQQLTADLLDRLTITQTLSLFAHIGGRI